MLSSQEHLLPFKLFRTLQFRKFHLFTPSHKANYWQEWDQTVCPHCLVSALSPLQDHDHTPPIYSSDKWGNNHPAESFSSSHTLESSRGHVNLYKPGYHPEMLVSLVWGHARISELLQGAVDDFPLVWGRSEWTSHPPVPLPPTYVFINSPSLHI